MSINKCSHKKWSMKHERKVTNLSHPVVYMHKIEIKPYLQRIPKL